MAKTVSSRSKKTKREIISLALTARNYYIIGFGILLILIGYVLMSANSVDGFGATVAAPILLVIGYCVVVPYGILYTDKTPEKQVEETVVVKEKQGNITTASSNIRTN